MDIYIWNGSYLLLQTAAKIRDYNIYCQKLLNTIMRSRQEGKSLNLNSPDLYRLCENEDIKNQE